MNLDVLAGGEVDVAGAGPGRQSGQETHVGYGQFAAGGAHPDHEQIVALGNDAEDAADGFQVGYFQFAPGGPLKPGQ